MIRFDASPSRKPLRGYLLWFGVWVAVTTIAALLSPSKDGHGTHQQIGLPPCGSVVIFQRPCPGCGMTTSFTHFVHGQFVESFQVHPFGFIGYIVFTASAFVTLYAYLKQFSIDTSGPVYGRFVGLLLGSFLLYGAWRFATETVEYRPAPRSMWERIIPSK